MTNTISYQKARRKGEEVSLDYISSDEVKLGFIVDEALYVLAETGGEAYEIDHSEENFEVLKDGGDAYAEHLNLHLLGEPLDLDFQ